MLDLVSWVEQPDLRLCDQEHIPTRTLNQQCFLGRSWLPHTVLFISSMSLSPGIEWLKSVISFCEYLHWWSTLAKNKLPKRQKISIFHFYSFFINLFVNLPFLYFHSESHTGTWSPQHLPHVHALGPHINGASGKYPFHLLSLQLSWTNSPSELTQAACSRVLSLQRVC